MRRVGINTFVFTNFSALSYFLHVTIIDKIFTLCYSKGANQ